MAVPLTFTGALLVQLLMVVVRTAEANPNGLGAKPAMGWNTWCTMGACGQDENGNGNGGVDGPLTRGRASFHDVCNEQEILEVAQAMVSSGMQSAGYEYVTLDDCWCAMDRDASGQLQGDTERFPRGMKPFIDTLHSMGFKVGLYISAGITTCSSGGRPRSIPGSYGHYDQDARTLAQGWGADWVKMDWCDWHWNSTVLLPGPTTRTMAEALNRTGRPVWFNFHCIQYGLPDTAWCADYGNSYRTWTDHHDNWRSTMSVIEYSMMATPPAAYAGRFAWPDPDYLMTGGAGCNNATAGLRCPGQTDAEYRSEFSLWVLAGGQLVVASDLRNMSQLQREVLLNAELLAVFNDPLAEIGRLASVWPCKGVTATGGGVDCTVWVKRLSGGQCCAVGLLNADNSTSHRITAEFLSLKGMNWTAKTQATVRDLWAHQDEAAVTGSYTAEVQPHATKVVRLCAPATAAAQAGGGVHTATTATAADDDATHHHTGAGTVEGQDPPTRKMMMKKKK